MSAAIREACLTVIDWSRVIMLIAVIGTVVTALLGWTAAALTLVLMCGGAVLLGFTILVMFFWKDGPGRPASE